MNILEILLSKTGKGIKTGIKDTGKGLAVAGREIVHELPTVAAIAGTIAPEVSPVFSVAESISGLVARRPSAESLPASNPLSAKMAGIFNTSITGENMNPLEAFAVTMVLGILQSVIKNPAHKAALETQLVGVADQIYMAYGMAPAQPVQVPRANEGPAALTPNSH